MKRVLEDAAKSLEPLYLRKSIVFSLDIPEKSSPALADPEAILLVASNLIGNAIKYTGEGGTVTAGVVSMENDRIKIFVRDNGIGIAAEDREKILSGHRTEAGRQAAKGFGVGLTLVKKMLDAHATTLEIEGAPGQGSCFSFILPCWKNPVEGDLFF
jgi:signal transduction histidine kinase